MNIETEKKWVLAALISGGLMLLTVILAVCHVSTVIVLLFALAAAAMIVATVLNLSDEEAAIAKYAWLILPLVQFLCVLIMKGAKHGDYGVWQNLAFSFGIFGGAEFITLLLAKKCWKTFHVLIAGAILIVLTVIWTVIKALALAQVCATYAAAIAGLALILLDIYISNQFKQTAADKGYEGRQYFWLVFFLPFAGMILVAALPDKNMNNAIMELVKDTTAKEETKAEENLTVNAGEE